MTTSPYVTPQYSWRTPEEYDLDWYTEFASMMSSVENSVFNMSTEAASGVVTLSANSACWVSACKWTQVASSLSGYWEDTHTTVSANSADWGASKVDWPAWDATEIEYDSGWVSLPYNTANGTRIAHGLGAEPDLVMVWGAGESYGDRMMTAQWGMNYDDQGVGIVELNSTNVTIHGKHPCVKWYNQPQVWSCSANPADFRVLCIDKSPDYTGTWTAVPTLGSQVSAAHGIGSTPDIYVLELADSNDGTGDHGYVMAGHYDYSSGIAPTVVEVNSTDIVLSFGATHLVDYYDYANTKQDIDTATGWWYRVKAWDWTPDYTSAWTQMSSTICYLTLYHNLDEIPFLYLLEFSMDSGGAGSVVPMMHPSMVSDESDYGVHLQTINQKYAVVRYNYGTHHMANFEDKDGTIRNVTTGYIRLKCWI